jgi:ADP-ribosyl-[dinitrogen reductase] hydrolase
MVTFPREVTVTAAIAGQLAGAYYGVEGIPERWLKRLHMRDDVAAMAQALYAKASAR